MGKIKDMTGKKFEHCQVIGFSGLSNDNKATWECLCECGGVFVTTGKALRDGSSKSCGCLKTKIILEASRKNRKHGETNNRLYNIWRGIKKRCYIPNDTSYKNYGAKGIKVCDEWLNSYEKFRDWAMSNGYEDNLTIDRIDSEGDYTPENCRWANWKQQGRNRSNNKRIMYKGKRMTFSEVAEKIGISRELLYYRYNHGVKLDEPKRISVGGRYVKEDDLQ